MSLESLLRFGSPRPISPDDNETAARILARLIDIGSTFMRHAEVLYAGRDHRDRAPGPAFTRALQESGADFIKMATGTRVLTGGLRQLEHSRAHASKKFELAMRPIPAAHESSGKAIREREVRDILMSKHDTQSQRGLVFLTAVAEEDSEIVDAITNAPKLLGIISDPILRQGLAMLAEKRAPGSAAHLLKISEVFESLLDATRTVISGIAKLSGINPSDALRELPVTDPLLEEHIRVAFEFLKPVNAGVE